MRKFKLFLRAGMRALPFLLIAIAFFTVLLFPKKEKRTKNSVPRVVRIWHIDTFEGGKGSRATFLKDAARIVEKKDKSVFYLVSNYTIEGARTALNENQKPDLLSFGVGLSDFLETSLPLERRRFSGGEAEGSCLAYPWCAGRYSIFSLNENFAEEGKTAISFGGRNLSELAAYLNGVDGETVESTTAYVDFLNGKYRYLLGTQRDECRFSARGVSVYRKELSAYCDLYQYIACLSAEKAQDCQNFIDTLLSGEVQNRLSAIGMYSLTEVSADKTVSVFSSDDALLSLTKAVREKTDLKNIDKFLKSI